MANRRSRALAVPAAGVLAPSPAEAKRLCKRILTAWLSESPTGSPHTRAAKLNDLDQFVEWILHDAASGEANRMLVLERLFFGGFADAQEAVRGWLAWMAQRVQHEDGKARARFSPATRARRLAHLRSLVRVAQEYGLPWGLQLRGPKIRPYRDASGPESWKVYKAIADLVERARDPERTDRARARAARDAAVLQLAFCLGLRRASIAGLDVADIDGAALWLRVKGEEEPRRRSLPPPTAAAIAAWLTHRGKTPGPLFTGVREGEIGERLTVTQIYRLCVRHVANPHGLRHAGATKLAREGHTVFELQAHLGHQNAMTAQHYVDASEDAPGQTAAYLAEQLAALYDGPDGTGRDRSR